MNLGELIRRMAEAGAPPEAIAIAVEAVETTRAIAAAEIEARRANDRERKQRSRDGHVTVTGRHVTPSPKKEKSPHTPLKEKTTPPITPSVEANASSSPKGDEPKKTPREILLECLSTECADGVLAHRKALKKPLTGRAAQLLAKGFLATADPNAAADMMIARGWQGFKPEWFDNERRSNGQPQQGQSRKRSISDVAASVIQRIDEQFAYLDEVRPAHGFAEGGPTVRMLPTQRGKRP